MDQAEEIHTSNVVRIEHLRRDNREAREKRARDEARNQIFAWRDQTTAEIVPLAAAFGVERHLAEAVIRAAAAALTTEATPLAVAARLDIYDCELINKAEEARSPLVRNAAYILVKGGKTCLADVAAMSRQELMSIRGIGPRTVDAIDRWVWAHGVSLKRV